MDVQDECKILNLSAALGWKYKRQLTLVPGHWPWDSSPFLLLSPGSAEGEFCGRQRLMFVTQVQPKSYFSESIYILVDYFCGTFVPIHFHCLRCAL